MDSVKREALGSCGYPYACYWHGQVWCLRAGAFISLHKERGHHTKKRPWPLDDSYRQLTVTGTGRDVDTDTDDGGEEGRGRGQSEVGGGKWKVQEWD